MRTPNIGSVFYAAGEPPQSAEAMQRFLFSELQKIAAALNALAIGHLDKTTVAPLKPRDGDIRYASGVGGWNPGSGVGIYYYSGTAWVLLG